MESSKRIDDSLKLPRYRYDIPFPAQVSMRSQSRSFVVEVKRSRKNVAGPRSQREGLADVASQSWAAAPVVEPAKPLNGSMARRAAEALFTPAPRPSAPPPAGTAGVEANLAAPVSSAELQQVWYGQNAAAEPQGSAEANSVPVSPARPKAARKVAKKPAAAITSLAAPVVVAPAPIVVEEPQAPGVVGPRKKFRRFGLRKAPEFGPGERWKKRLSRAGR